MSALSMTKERRAMAAATRSSKARSILVVEDEGDLSELICYNLEREGYTPRPVDSGDAALAEVRRKPPDLILLDRMLPGVSGDDVCAQLRRDSATVSIPIIMLTAKGEESDQLVGFALGADDYIPKPFSIKVLLARVTAILRRGESANSEDDQRLSVGPVLLDISRHQVKVDGGDVALTATEFKLLRVLMTARGRVLDRTRIVEKVLGSNVVVTDRTIDVHITALRKKIGAASRPAAGWIQTIRGAGYAFREPTGD